MADPRRDNSAGPASAEHVELAPPPFILLDDPLAFIDADHVRHRTICRVLRRLSDQQSIERALARDVVTVMTKDLALHHRDEDEDLLPLLMKRALPEDGLVPILVQLGEDHIAAAATAKKLATELSTAAEAPLPKLNRRAADLANRFATCEQRHLAIESGIVMVIARKRLKPPDLLIMSQSMKLRRGISAVR